MPRGLSNANAIIKSRSFDDLREWLDLIERLMTLRSLVIIPAYNEEEAILETVKNVVSSGYDYVVVNDGSKDDTLDLCRKNGVNVLDLPHNLGIGGAVQAGHMYAQRHGYDIDIQFDGDGQHDASYLDELVSKIEEGRDLVIGSRYLASTDGFQSTAMRRFGKSLLSGVIRLVSGEVITDPTSGFRACGRRAIDLFCIDYPTDYPEPESIVHALNSGLEIEEVPVLMHERQGGISSIGVISSAYYMIKVTLAILIDSLAYRLGRNR